MSTNENDFGQVIALLEARYVEAQKAANEKLATLNAVRHEAGLPARGPGLEGPSAEGGAALTQIKDDTFYGKKRSTAMREYLEMRRTQRLGPAKPREIFEALKLGGYQFETKDDVIALVGLRGDLRKNSATFHKLPTGAYGLRSWYPTAKATEADEDEPQKAKKKIAKGGAKRRGRPRKPKVGTSSTEDKETAAD